MTPELSNHINGIIRDTLQPAIDILTKTTKLSKEQMFQWIVDNNATITRNPIMKWTNQDGSHFLCNFTLSAEGTQYAAAPTLEEAIQMAYESQTKNIDPDNKIEELKEKIRQLELRIQTIESSLNVALSGRLK